ncbi:hypothetical protein CORC01_04859 [Colletotrichum orchidophilum]|uniref:C2H2-type domain-containing protein n=1 Tax=Colletotrichum orchidophilum TaxID=1209926 RepID=A0A1G4BF14_9PEZI|nr:uncharacterized protein CORC01_04859 [Colletotrichum orchidophilum]OHE99958.1 hypothetical protein CORC01_04859 [Colletotrichum orchidophilum]
MYFLHKRRCQIVTQLMLTFEDETDVDDTPREAISDDVGGMSVEEKLRLWANKMDVTCVSPPQQDRFQGIEDTEEDTLGPVAMPEYRSIVLSGNAFQWLVACLKTEMSLQCDQDHSGNNTRREIRQAILECLPTGRISKKNSPKIHTVRFRLLEWPFIAASAWQPMDREAELFVRRPTFESIIVAYCKDGGQAISIKRYLAQVWPSTWSSLLNLLLPVMDYFEDHSPHEPCIGTSISLSLSWEYEAENFIVDLVHNYCTNLRATFEGNHLVVTVQAPSYLIAEFGEQLAWLSAAVSRHFDGPIAHRTPAIFRKSVDEARYCEDLIGFDIAVEEEVKKCLTPQEARWTQVLDRRFVAIAGFPVLSRPAKLPGTEVSWEILEAFLGEYNFMNREGQVFLEGSDKTVALVKYHREVYLWRNVSSGERPCCHSTGESKDDFTDVMVCELLKFQISRHILDSVDEAAIGTNPYFHDKEATSAPGFSNRMHWTTPGQNLSRITGRVLNTSTTGKDDEHSIIDLTLDGPSPKDASCHFDVTDKSETSFESDLLSISDLSDEASLPRLSENDPVFLVIKDVALTLLTKHRFQTRGKTTGGGGVPASVASTNPQGQALPLNSEQLPAKGKRKVADELDSEQGSKKKIYSAKKQEPTLACPFWKLDPLQHHNCARRKLTRVRDVKQHLNRGHTPKHYCQRCLRLFADDYALCQHVSDENGWTCPLSAPDTLNGVSHEQSRKLHRKSAPSLSDENQWFAIWEILFPGKTRPRSAYMNPEISEDLEAFQQHLDSRAGPVLHQALELAGLLEGITTEEETQLVQRVISQALFRMQRDWLSSRSLIPQATNSVASFVQTPRSNIHASSFGTPAASSADSGIALGPQNDSVNIQLAGSHGPLPSNADALAGQHSSFASAPQTLGGTLDFTQPTLSGLSNLPTEAFHWGQTDRPYEAGLAAADFAVMTHDHMSFAALDIPCFDVGGTEAQIELARMEGNAEELRSPRTHTSAL